MLPLETSCATTGLQVSDVFGQAHDIMYFWRIYYSEADVFRQMNDGFGQVDVMGPD